MMSHIYICNCMFYLDFRNDEISFHTRQIEEGVKNVEPVSVISLDELVSIVVLNVFPVNQTRKHESLLYLSRSKN